MNKKRKNNKLSVLVCSYDKVHDVLELWDNYTFKYFKELNKKIPIQESIDKGLKMLLNGLQYILFKTGPVNSIGVDCCSFINPENLSDSVDPKIKLYCVQQSFYSGKIRAYLLQRNLPFEEILVIFHQRFCLFKECE